MPDYCPRTASPAALTAPAGPGAAAPTAARPDLAPRAAVMDHPPSLVPVRWVTMALVALAGMLRVGCGDEPTKDSTEPVTFLEGHATIFPLRSAYIAVHDAT